MDAFQGREKDIIIFNCVRSNSNSSSVQAALGFLIDDRRLNVAITRPRHFLVILGDSRTLVKSNTWDSMIKSFKNKMSKSSYFKICDKNVYSNPNNLY